ncbi:MAG: anhydro-N-acetylmuramic acid kinase [Proteobacteria bacterium]|nr:anhydro-N-acetylmuramic acid kinase [Pseudomonadota bacterium]
MKKIKTAIGLMSGTSIDGIDVALIKSDGTKIISRDLFGYYPYDKEIRDKVRELVDKQTASLTSIKEVELDITKKHIYAVLDFLEKNKLSAKDIDIVGFHGHTIIHDPSKPITWQIGNAQMLATTVGIDVIADFRTRDIICGGQGAPLTPAYHHALFKDRDKPLAVLNIGGVSNITYIQSENAGNVIGFDTCFGNAPIDDLVKDKTGKNFDKNGALAKKGKVNYELSEEFLTENYFAQLPPKSLDRNQFNKAFEKFKKIKLEDALATLTHILAKSIEIAIKQIPNKPKEIIVCGGGRRNKAIMDDIKKVNKGIKVIDIDDLGINGDSIEAEAFAFLAIKSLDNSHVNFQKIAGINSENPQNLDSHPFCGGVLYHA